MPGEDLDQLFVYGTLMPGHLRWPMLEPTAASWAPVVVPGELWDTGNGWPAARFAGTAPGQTVPGWCVRFRRGALAGLLASLDEMEGIGAPPDPSVDPYVRTVVEVPGHGPAWAYDATRIGAGWRPIDAWEGRAEA